MKSARVCRIERVHVDERVRFKYLAVLAIVLALHLYHNVTGCIVLTLSLEGNRKANSVHKSCYCSDNSICLPLLGD